MSLISLHNISISFGSMPLLDNTNLHLEDNERICILGRNGMGKSTLLKIINGELVPDSGEIIKQVAIRSARLEQDVPTHITGSVFDVITAGLGEQGKLLSAYEKLSHQLTLHPNEKILNELEQVQQQLDKHQAWNLTPKVEHIIEKLALPRDQLFSELSGGLKRRVLLGQALVLEPHILLLDEPTNHLDIESIDWLENFLIDFPGAVIFITHDRMFMQKVATRIIEIDRGKLQSYPGNYQQYVERKQHELEVEETHNRNFDKKLAQEEVWIRQGIKARRTRNEGRVRELEKLRKLRSERREVMGKVNMQLQQAEQSGKLVIEAKNIEYCYQNKTLINRFSTVITRGDKIGIIGPNGVGKSTLLKILLDQTAPQKGSIRHGTKLEIAYFDQLRSQLDEDNTVEQNVGYGDQYVNVNGKSVHIISYLRDFLFSPERARTPVRSLSGGERNRLLLARLFSKPSNVLVLDEPTNDLDIETLELLEELIINYEGTLLLVSHDRSFLNNIVTSTIVFEGDGKLNEYVGGYDDWLRQKNISAEPSPPPMSSHKPIPNVVSVKNNYSQQKELRAVEQKIEKLELQLVETQEKLTDTSLYETENANKLQILHQKLNTIEIELKDLYQRWEELA
ncbi:MAG: ATP-binding cassette domain-containing protein [Gammaproteobacteria bacterium]